MVTSKTSTFQDINVNYKVGEVKNRYNYIDQYIDTNDDFYVSEQEAKEFFKYFDDVTTNKLIASMKGYKGKYNENMGGIHRHEFARWLDVTGKKDDHFNDGTVTKNDIFRVVNYVTDSENNNNQELSEPEMPVSNRPVIIDKPAPFIQGEIEYGNFGPEGHYTKRYDYNGIYIYGSSQVQDNTLIEAARQIHIISSGNPTISENIAKNGGKVVILGENENIEEHPELSWVSLRAIAISDYGVNSITLAPEENILGLEADRDPIYHTENLLVHEHAHIMYQAMKLEYGDVVEEELKAAYNNAKDQGLWQNHYALSHSDEYWAEGVQSYFNVNYIPVQHGGVATREELKDYDPMLYNLIKKYLGEPPTL